MDPRTRPDVRTIGGSALRALSVALVSQEAVCQMRSVSMSCCYFGGLSAHARGPPRASTSGGGQRPVNSLSPRIGETRRGGGTAGGLARQGAWLPPYRHKRRPVPVLCRDRWEGRNCARGFQAIRHGESHGIPKREQAMPGGTGTWLSRGRGVIERRPNVHASSLLEPLGTSYHQEARLEGKMRC